MSPAGHSEGEGVGGSAYNIVRHACIRLQERHAPDLIKLLGTLRNKQGRGFYQYEIMVLQKTTTIATNAPIFST